MIPRDPDRTIEGLIRFTERTSALAVVRTETLAGTSGAIARLAERHDLSVADLSRVSSPFEDGPGLTRRRVVTGLSWLKLEARAERAMAMNRARDRIFVLGQQVLIWILREDYPWFYETAPDLCSRVMEVVDIPEPPRMKGGPDALLIPFGEAAAPVHVPPGIHWWLKEAGGTPRGRAAAVGAEGPGQVRQVVDALLSEGRGPAAWIDLRFIDGERAGRWVGERGDLRLLVARGGVPPRDWPAEPAQLVCDVEADQLPLHLASAPSPEPSLEVVEAPSPEPAASPGLLALSDLDTSPLVSGWTPPPELREPERWLVVAPPPELARSGAASVEPAIDAGVAWTLHVENGVKGEGGRLDAWLVLAGSGVPDGPLRTRKPWSLSPEDGVMDALAEAMRCPSPPGVLGVVIDGGEPGDVAARELCWEALESRLTVAVVRSPREGAPGPGAGRVLLFVSRPGRSGQVHPDPWFLLDRLRTVLGRKAPLELELVLEGSRAALEAALTQAQEAGRPFDALVMDCAVRRSPSGRLSQILVEGPGEAEAASRPAEVLDPGGLAWAIEGSVSGAVILAGWEDGETGPELREPLAWTLLKAGAGAVLCPGGSRETEARYEAIGALIDALGAGASVAEAGRRARRAAGASALEVHGRAGVTLVPGASEEPASDRKEIDGAREVPDEPHGELVGRQMETFGLIRSLNAGTPTLITGMVGVGKSTLAAAVARRWVGLGPGRRVLWVEVRSEADLKLGRLEPAKPPGTTLVVVDRLDGVFGPVNTQLPPAVDHLLSALREIMVQHGAHVLLVSRSPVFMGPRTHMLWLGGLSAEQGRSLLVTRATALGLDPGEARMAAASLDSNQADHPGLLAALAEVLAGLGRKGHWKEDAIAARQATALQAALDRLDDESRASLPVIAAFERIVPVGVLAELLGRGVVGSGPFERAGRLLGALATVGLANVVAGGAAVHPALSGVLPPPARALKGRWAAAMVDFARGLHALARSQPAVAAAMGAVVTPEVIAALKELLRSKLDDQARVEAMEAVTSLLLLAESARDEERIAALEGLSRELRAGLSTREMLDIDISDIERKLRRHAVIDPVASTEALLQRARHLARHRDRDLYLLLRALYHAADARRRSADPAGAWEHLNEAEAVLDRWSHRDRPDGRRWRAILLELKGIVLTQVGRDEAARAAFDEVIALADELGDRHLRANTLRLRNRLADPDPRARRDELEHLLMDARRAGDQGQIVELLHDLAFAYLNEQEVDQAVLLAREAVLVAQRAHLSAWEGLGLLLVGRGLATLARSEEAERVLLDAVDKLQAVDHRSGLADALYLLAHLWTASGQWARAAQAASQARALNAEHVPNRWQAAVLEAQCLSRAGRDGESEQALGQAIRDYIVWRHVWGGLPQDPEALRLAARADALAPSPSSGPDLVSLSFAIGDPGSPDQPSVDLALERAYQAWLQRNRRPAQDPQDP